MKLIARRTAVVLGVTASLLLGVVSIRAAAAWTAASAPLASVPVSVASLTDELAAEQARSAALQAQLDDLAGRSTELTGALEAAQGRMTTDAATAKDLRARLAAATKKLAALTQSLKQAARASTASVVVTGAPVPPAPTPRGEPEHEGGDD